MINEMINEILDKAFMNYIYSLSRVFCYNTIIFIPVFVKELSSQLLKVIKVIFEMQKQEIINGETNKKSYMGKL